MSRTDPPPRTKPPPTRPSGPSGLAAENDQEGADASSGEIEIDVDEDIVVDDDDSASVVDAEIVVGEGDVGDFPWDGLDPDSPHDRATVAPPMPEREYVAQMMKGVSDRVPPSRSITPRRGVKLTGAMRSAPAQPQIDERSKSGLPTPAAPRPPRTVPPDESARLLTLDLSETFAPAPVPSFGRTPEPERTTLPSACSDAQQANVAPQFSFGPTSGDALELVGVRAQSVKPGAESKATMTEVRDRFDVGDFTGALALAAQILEKDPEHVDALLYAEHCRDVLKQMYISNLGGLRRVPQVVVSAEQLRWLALDHRAGFLLSLVDGRSTFDEVLDVCGMPPFDAIRLLVQLLQQNVIRIL